MNVLFVCKYNRYRSKVAEALFNKYNRIGKLKALSAGVQIDFRNPLVSENVMRVLEEMGAKVVDEHSIAIDNILLNWADLIVIVADDVDSKQFRNYKKKIERWEIQDENQNDYEAIEKGVEKIDFLVRNLIERLEKEI